MTARISFARTTLLITLAVLPAFATTAIAQTPGSNGDIVIKRSDAAASAYVFDEVAPNLGSINRSTSVAPARETMDVHYSSNGSSVAINIGGRTEACGGVPKCQGAYLGSADELGVTANGAMYFPGNPLVDELTCSASADVVATLADGNLLWKRTWYFRPDMPTSNCTNYAYSGRVVEDLAITTPGNQLVRTAFRFESRNGVETGTRVPGHVFASGPDANVAYSYSWSTYLGVPQAGLFRSNLATGQVEQLDSTIRSSFTPTDVSPDGTKIVGRDTVGGTAAITVFDIATKVYTPIVSAAQADTILPSTKANPGAYTGLQHPTFAPDGTRIAFSRHNTTDQGGRDAVLTVALDGSAGVVVREVPASSYVSDLAWRPSPGFTVRVGGEQLVGDIVEFDLELVNPRDHAFTDLEFDSAGASGIIFNDQHFSPENRAKFTVLAGPAPSLPSVLGPKFVSTHQYLTGFDGPGSLQIRGQVRASHPNGTRVEARDSADVLVQNRPTSKGERVQIASAAYAELQTDLQQDAVREFDVTQARIDAAMKATLSGTAEKAALAETPLEETLATNMGLPDDALSWLPKDPKVAIKAYWAFRESSFRAEESVVKRSLGSAYKFVVGEPWAYWKQQFTGDATTTLSTIDQLANEAAYYANEGERSARAFGAKVSTYVNDPDARAQMNEAAFQSAAIFEQRMAKIAEVAPSKAKAIAKEFQRDPVAGARKLGQVYGTIRAEISIAAVETVVGNKLTGAKVVKGIAANVKRFDKTVGHSDEIADAAEDVFAPLRAVTKPSKFDRPPSAAQLGMPKADQARWAGIVAKLEQHAKSKFGVDLDLELSFRPRNVHSADVADAAGKNMFMKGKTGTDLDVMLGMDPSGLGKLSIYKPKRPANYAKLDPLTRKEIDLRIKDIDKAYKEWHNPKSNLGLARRKGGVELSAKLDSGAPVTKLKMQIQGIEKNGTISVRYNEFIVDGKAIVRKGAKPKWVVSDYDGNAFLQAKGKALPGGAVRGALEAELMRLQREAGVDMPVSFHGFTSNGFDMSAKHYRMNFHFLLEGMTRKQADTAVAMYIRKYAQNADEVKDLLGSYKYGDYVVRVTRSGATGGQGL